MTPRDRIAHYCRWHVAAYFAPAPKADILAVVAGSNGMTCAEAEALLEQMVADGILRPVACGNLPDGYEPNT